MISPRARRITRRAAISGAVTACAVIAGLAAWVVMPLPARVLDDPASQGVRIEDRHGVILRSTRAADGTRTQWVPVGEMDPDLILAFVAVEDRRFWDHRGIDWRAVARAARDNLRAGRIVSGASTISMQLARLLNPGTRGWRSKASETFWAMRLERHLTKQQILEQYLNRVHLGQAAVGVGAASRLYFGSTAAELSIAEAATLAGLAHAPSRDNPFVSPKRAAARRQVAIRRMYRAGAIGRADFADAQAEAVLPAKPRAPFLAPHFTSHLLADRGAANRGDVWRTTLDAGLQRELEAEVKHAIELLSTRGVRHAALVVLENRTGDVLAWVGSPDFWAARSGQTDMVISARQPGSALKPFLYALAFDRGTTAATVLPDIPRSYATATGPYSPRNYDRRFRGPVRAREALASSYNVPAVELAARVGAGALLQTLHLAGFESLTRGAEHYGLGLALGNGDVTLLELANAYRGLANGGVWFPVAPMLVGSGDAAARSEPPASAGGRRFVSAQAAALVLDVLSDASARVPGFGLETPFDFPFPAAAKTGTSRHFTDNWAVAATAGFTVAVWVGNFSGEPMQGVSGVTGAGPLLHRAVTLTANRYAPGVLPTPAQAGLAAVDVCRLSGLRATTECPAIREWFLPGSEPRAADSWIRAGHTTLPPEYTEWAAQAGGEFTTAEASGFGSPARIPGTDPSAAHALPDSATGLRLVSPLDGDVYRVQPGVPAEYSSLPLRVAGAEGGVRWYVNGSPYTRARWPLTRGVHVVRAESGDASVVARIIVE